MSRSPFVSANVNVPAVNGETTLKHGFHWLRQQNAAGAVTVDENTDASLLEHLVFK